MNLTEGISYKKVVNHAICWLLLMCYELLLLYYSIGQFSSIWPYLFYYTCNIAVFYCQVEALNLTLSDAKPKYIKLITLVFGEISVFLVIKIIADYLFTDFSKIQSAKFQVMKQMATLDLFRNIYYAAFGTLYWTINNINNYQKKADAAEIKSLKNQRDTAAMQIELAKSQNAYLQQQINPHLLFNSLNFVHSSVYKQSPEAAENIILLSDIIRFSLGATDDDGKVKLSDEAEQLENLAKINRFRFDYPIDVNYITEGDLAGHKVIPLVLMTLAENLFKHGDLKSKPAMIRLSVSEAGELNFYTYNHKRPAAPFDRVKSIGIENIRIRLNFTYGSGYKLSVKQTDEIYESELTIQL
jgi:sensor histidine kinase YesM